MTDQPHTHDPDIVPDSIEEPAKAPDAQPDDPDHQWLETVLASLPERSREAREALLKALMNGDAPATEGSRGEAPLVHPVSGTTSFSR